MLFALLASTGVTWFVGVLCSTTAKLGCGFRRAHVILCLLIVCNIANFIFAFDAGQYVVGGCSWLPWFRPLLSTENGTAVVVPTHAPTSAPPNSTARGFDSSSGAFALRGSSGGSALASGGGSTARWYISSCLLIDVLSFIIRRSTVQGVFGVKKSLLMDHVPKKARGCWNAVDSIESSFWSGTAAVGGYVIHRWGFRVNLQIMAWGYLASLVACVRARAASNFENRRDMTSPSALLRATFASPPAPFFPSLSYPRFSVGATLCTSWRGTGVSSARRRLWLCRTQLRTQAARMVHSPSASTLRVCLRIEGRPAAARTLGSRTAP
jgi:hypothetical protein